MSTLHACSTHVVSLVLYQCLVSVSKLMWSVCISVMCYMYIVGMCCNSG